MRFHFGSSVVAWSAGLLLITAANASAGANDLPDGAGKVPLQRICSACHAPEIVVGRHETKDHWGEIVSNMVEKGAVGTDDELNQIVDYLAANFAKTGAGGKSDSSEPNPKK